MIKQPSSTENLTRLPDGSPKAGILFLYNDKGRPAQYVYKEPNLERSWRSFRDAGASAGLGLAAFGAVIAVCIKTRSVPGAKHGIAMAATAGTSVAATVDRVKRRAVRRRLHVLIEARKGAESVKLTSSQARENWRVLAAHQQHIVRDDPSIEGIFHGIISLLEKKAF